MDSKQSTKIPISSPTKLPILSSTDTTSANLQLLTDKKDSKDLNEERIFKSKEKGKPDKTAQSQLVLFSANANSLKNKMTSLLFNIDLLKPSIIVIQETKIKNKSKLKINGYRCFATTRGDSGGGLLIACLLALDPTLIFEGDCECEVLVVQASIGNQSLRIIAGYGPQECAPIIVREKYRGTVETQVERSYLAGCMVIIAEDANAKLGPDVIPNDPNLQSENGKLLHSMIQRQDLVIVNTSQQCTGGPITRSRCVKGRVESSCIDFILTSRCLAQNLEKAIIDSNQLYCLTKFTTTKGNPCVKRSDHHSLIAYFDISWKNKQKKREEIFKLRDADGLQKFRVLSTKSEKLLRSVELPVEDACNRWYKEIDRLLHQCFRKIKISNLPPKKSTDYQIYLKLSEIKTLKELYAVAHPIHKSVLNSEIQFQEKKLAEAQGKRCQSIIKEEMSKLSEDGKFSLNEAWKLKKKLFPRCSDSPFAVLDKSGNLVADHAGILDVMKEEFTYRLRNREINDEYSELKELKEYLCHLRLEITRTSSYSDWTMDQLQKAIAKLRNNKCKDPHGHINELYKHLGHDGLVSLLKLLNKIKATIIIPSKLDLSNVSTIYKGKGSKQDVINLRGIFKLPILRNLLDRLICYDEEETVSSSMGQFQVGNQKDRNIRDHTLVVQAVINEAHDKKLKIDAIFTDIKQCFDSVWLEEATNDLYESGITNRNINLLYEGNKKTRMCVETNIGKSKRVELRRVVMQGSVTGGMICSNQISKLCNNLFNEGEVYMYNGIVPIPALAMVDDIAVIAECNSTHGLNCNIKTDTFIQRKKLEGQVGDGKCQWVHIGPGECTASYKMNDEEITEANSYKHLGDYVADNLETLYIKRWEKAQGYSSTCQAMCTEMSLGYHTYSIVRLLHESIFINGTLVNMETWTHTTNARIEMFERTEQALFRKILCAHSKTPIECLYLELGVLPLRFHLMSRRIMYLQHILKRNSDELVRLVVMCQKETCRKGDFYTQTKDNLKYLQINEDDLVDKTKKQLSDLVSRKLKRKAFEYLMEKASNHSKVRESCYKDCEGTVQYKDPRFTPNLINILFRFRTRTYMVKNNFRNNYTNTNTSCPLCKNENDDQQHIFDCNIIQQQYNEPIKHSIDDIYSSDADTLLSVSEEILKLTQIRERILDPEEGTQ